MEFATCAKLLNYPDAAAPDGWNLQPEVAAAMPEVSTDGRTYAFTVRADYRFSPPSGEPLTAETFRYSIQRAAPPGRRGGHGRVALYDIVGERQFLRGQADHISGLQAEGDTLTIYAVEPSADFLHRLSVPYFCPVPSDAPPVPGGAGRAGYPHGTPLAVPSAGPNYIADHLTASTLSSSATRTTPARGRMRSTRSRSGRGSTPASRWGWWRADRGTGSSRRSIRS